MKKGLRVLILALPLGLLASLAHAEPQLKVVGGADLWSQSVARDWTPRSRAALLSLQAFAHDRYGVDLADEALGFTLAATPQAAREATAVAATHLLVLEAGQDEARLRRQALIRPLHEGLFLLMDRLTQEHRSRLPEWLPEALAGDLARQLVAGMNLPPVPSYVPDEAPPEQRKGLAAMAALRTKLGGEFDAHMRAYLQAASGARFDADAEFKAQFGEAPAELLQQAGQGAVAGNAAVLSNGMGAALSRVDSSTAEPGVQQAFAAMMAAAKPRALAFGPGGQWGLGENSPRAMDRAIEACRAKVRGDCRIVAVDDNMVPDIRRAYVMVQMGGYVDDAFSADVRDHWLALVRQSTGEFDRLVSDVLKVPLGRDVRVYLGAGTEDYEQILVRDMNVRGDRAELQGEVTGGLSNKNGQIAVKFTPALKRPALYERAVKTPLHELTHELQKQLGTNYSGFRPPTWMIEGTADLMAALLARNLRIADGEAEGLRDSRERNLGWWRKGNKTNLQPDDLAGVVGDAWLRLMKDKRGAYQMAGLMTMYLQAINGERFLPAWVAYFRSAGQTRRAGAAFEKAFGLSEDAFVDDFKKWLAQQ